MKILMVNKFLYPNGGSETYIFETGRMLQEMGHEVQYFGMEHEGRIVGNHAESYTRDMEFHSASFLQKLSYPRSIVYSREARRKIRVVLDDFQPDVVHLNNINFQLTPSVIDEIRAYDKARTDGGRTAIVSTAHDYQWVCPNHMLRVPSTGELCTDCFEGKFGSCTRKRCVHNSKLRSYLGAREARVHRRRHSYAQVDTVICPSVFMQNMLLHNPDLKGKTLMLHNFLPEEMRAAMEAGLTAGPSVIGKGVAVPGEPALSSLVPYKPKGYVLYFGRFDAQKGMIGLLNACRQLPEIPFVFAGKGPLEDELEGIDNVMNVGFLSGAPLRTLIRNAAFTVYPSVWYENCPFSVVESQLLGTPVVASDLGGTPELVEEGRTGMCYPGLDTDILEETIHALWSAPEEVERLRKGCLSMLDRFDSLETYCEKLLMIYEAAGNEN